MKVLINNADIPAERWWGEFIELACKGEVPHELMPLAEDHRSLPVDDERALDLWCWANKLPGWPYASAEIQISGSTFPVTVTVSNGPDHPLLVREWIGCEACLGVGESTILPCKCRVHSDDCPVTVECPGCDGEGGWIVATDEK